jgi:hypothetical protein
MAKVWQIFTKDSAISVGVVIAMMTAVVWFTRIHTQWSAEKDAMQVAIAEIRAENQELRDCLNAHMARGHNGFPHPAGVVHHIKELEKSMSDRWKKNDDYFFMSEFARLNDLQLPKHRTIDQAADGED